MDSTLSLSPLGHTWILDLDGTIVKHNGYLIDGHDTLLPGAKAFLDSIPAGDMIIFVTSRKDAYALQTEAYLKSQVIRFDKVIYNVPYGERILINDSKPSGLTGAIAISPKRDTGAFPVVSIDDRL